MGREKQWKYSSFHLECTKTGLVWLYTLWTSKKVPVDECVEEVRHEEVTRRKRKEWKLRARLNVHLNTRDWVRLGNHGESYETEQKPSEEEDNWVTNNVHT